MAESHDAGVMVSLKLLDAHPKNPRIRHDPEFIAGLAEAMKDGFDPVYAPTVRRKAEGRFEVIIGHRRTLAAKKAGLTEIPVKVVDWPEDKVLRELAFSNDQDRLSPLEIAIHSFEVEAAKGKKGAGLKEYASRWKLADSTLGRYRKGAKVYLAVKKGTSENVLGGLHDRVEHLAKIAEAPEPTWQQVVERLVAEDWSIKKTEHFVKEANAVGSESPTTEAPVGSVAEVVPLFPDGPPVNDKTGGDNVEDDDDDDDDEEPESDDGGLDDAEHEQGFDEEQECERTVETKSVEKPSLTGSEPQQRNPEDAIIQMVSDFLERLAAIREMFVFPANMWADLFPLVDADVTVPTFLKALQMCVERHDLQRQLDVCPDKRGREARRLKSEIQAFEEEFKALLAEQVE